MVQRPLPDEARGFFWETAMDYVTRRDGDERLKSLVAGVKMGRRVIVMIHADHDAEKDGDDRHRLTRLIPQPAGSGAGFLRSRKRNAA